MGVFLDASRQHGRGDAHCSARRPGESVRDWYLRSLDVWEMQMRSLMGADAAKVLLASVCSDHACRLAQLERREEALRRQPFVGSYARAGGACRAM